jgi:hypothetical protein
LFRERSETRERNRQVGALSEWIDPEEVTLHPNRRERRGVPRSQRSKDGRPNPQLLSHAPVCAVLPYVRATFGRS